MLRAVVEWTVRALGLALLLVGLVGGYRALGEFWGLYQEPDRIERVAQAVEEASHIDRSLAAAVQGVLRDGDQDAAATAPAEEPPAIRISYYVAWVIVLLLLSMFANIALLAVRAGGYLALHELRSRAPPDGGNA